MSAYFYNETIKTWITAFGTIFENITYINDHDVELRVPIHYSMKEKFYDIYFIGIDFDEQEVSITFPRMGYQLDALSFASDRFNNPMSQIKSGTFFRWARIPYDFSFSLSLATVKYEDSLKIVEQILPLFVPELNLSVKDNGVFGDTTDIAVVLDSVNQTVDYEGDFETKRTVVWDFNFTLKGFLYSDLFEQQRIKESIIHFGLPPVKDDVKVEVIPRDALPNDPHKIITTISPVGES